MTDSDRGNKSLRNITTIPSEAVDSFSVLANETRLSILLTLWEAQYGRDGLRCLSFSDLRDRIGMRDSGQFNYHLDHLTDRFIRKTDEGYILTQGGARFIRTVVAWEGSERPDIEPTQLDRHCPFCEEPVQISYSEELVVLECTGCEGGGPALGNAISRGQLPPAGVIDRSPAEVLETTILYHLHLTGPMLNGFCPSCTSLVERRLECCPDHDTSKGSCPNCGSRFLGTVYMDCQTCHAPNIAPGWIAVMDHPAVVSFFHERGIDLWKEPWDGLFSHGAAAKEAPLDDDTVGVRITLTANGDQISVDLREDLSIEVAESP